MTKVRATVATMFGALALIVASAVGAAVALMEVGHAAAPAATRAGSGGDAFSGNEATTGGAEAAIAWASSFEAGQPNFRYSAPYSDFCLAFVANAYGAAAAGYDTAWDMAQNSTLNDPHNPAAAPRGSIIFFRPNSYNDEDGHVAIALGGGQMISANVPGVGIPNVVMDYPKPNIQSNSYWNQLYAAWTWPPSSWGPLAREAAASEPAPPTLQAPPTLHVQGSTSALQSTINGSSLQQAVNPTSVGKGSGGGSPGSARPRQTTAPAPVTTPPTTTPPTTPPPPPPPPTYAETAGGPSSTWTDFDNAGGYEGPQIASGATVNIACRVQGFAVPDGNTWWYRIASAPWSDNYYVSADAFFNGYPTSGGLKGTPFFDPNMPIC